MVTMSTSTRSRRRASPRRRPRRPYHHGDLRRALVAAALALVRSRGPEGFALREAARRVGVSQTAPYRHFATREALLAAVAEEGFLELHRRLEDVAASAGPDPLPRLRALGEASFEFYVADAARFRVMFGPASARKDRYPALAQAWGRVSALLLEALVACQRAGEIRQGDPVELGLTTSAMVHGLAALVVDGQLGDAAADPRAALEIYRRARAVLFAGLHPARAEP